MASASWAVNDEDDDDDLQQGGGSEALKDVILMAVDCSQSMLAQPEDDSFITSHFQDALKAAAELQRRKAKYGAGDMVGILFFNTVDKGGIEERKGDIKEHMYVYQPISQPNADYIQNLLSLVDESEKDSKFLEKKFRPWSRRVPLGEVFLQCNWLLRNYAPKTATKRIFLITDDDDPHKGNPKLDDIARKTIGDLYLLGVTVEPFFFNPPKGTFDPTITYTNVLSREEEGQEGSDAVSMPTVIEKFHQFYDEMTIREAPKRSQFSIPLTIGKGFVLGVKGYGLVIEQKKPVRKKFAQIDGQLQELSSRTTYFSEESMDEQLRGTIVFGMSLASTDQVQEGQDEEGPVVTQSSQQEPVSRSKIYYTQDDIKKFRTLGMEPGLRLLGFKDADTLAFEDNVKHSYFIYPSDLEYRGSTRAFSSLLQSMDKKDKIALVVGLLRRSSSPYIYAMVPQAERLVGDLQERPPGFNLIPLPFADDLRAAPPPPEHYHKASENLVQAARAIIDKVKIAKGYIPDAYPNPSLGLFYGQLEAIALRDEFNPEEFDDKTAPPLASIFKRTKNEVKVWKEALEEEPDVNTYDAVAPRAGTKRKAEISVDEAYVRSQYDAGKLIKLNRDTLKAFLSSKGVPFKNSDVKATLLEATENWISKNPED